MENKGFIYILSNASYPGILKIGATQNDPKIRAEQLSKATGALGKFEVEWFMKVPFVYLSESMLHHALGQFHYEKEYFRVELSVAKLAASSILEPLIARIQKGQLLWKQKDKAIKLKRYYDTRQLEQEASELTEKLLKLRF